MPPGVQQHTQPPPRRADISQAVLHRLPPARHRGGPDGPRHRNVLVGRGWPGLSQHVHVDPDVDPL
eukprot:8757243-Prorocentrum_lima.AAC.1